jgi:hypothetical protein
LHPFCSYKYVVKNDWLIQRHSRVPYVLILGVAAVLCLTILQCYVPAPPGGLLSPFEGPPDRN